VRMMLDMIGRLHIDVVFSCSVGNVCMFPECLHVLFYVMRIPKLICVIK
jgi:hypothetical protein